MLTPDYIPPHFGIPIAIVLWTTWALITIATARKHPMNTTARKLTTSQAAAVFGVTERTIRHWADEGKLPCTRTLGGARRFDAGTIERMAQA